MKIIPIIVALLACAACSRPPAEEASVNDAWTVYKGDREVLRYEEKPGPLTSTASPPKDAQRPMHPFLTASALDPVEEDALRRILESVKSPAEFRSALEKAGYSVRRP